MTLDKQVNIYSVDTSAFYDYYERFYDRLKYRDNIVYKINSTYKKLKKIKSLYNSKLKSELLNELQVSRYKSLIKLLETRYDNYNSIFENRKNECKLLLSGNDIKVKRKFICHQEGVFKAKKNYSNYVRTILPSAISEKDGVSIFDSSLVRILKLDYDKQINDSMFIVRIYYFDILEDLMKNGFYYNNQKYIFFGCSAGQIRQKKAVFIKEDLFKAHEKTIMCGLTGEEINRRGGMNVNKYMAYTNLINSATEIWQGFDIDKSIVVDDFETNFIGDVDYITYEEEEIDGVIYPPYSIIRRKMPVAIPHTDGFGIMLDGKTTMVRLPFVKGLMGVCPYDKFIREFSKKKQYRDCGKIKDIYGKEYDILADDIRYIFTKSQFKMWKYYDSWQQYKDYFKLYNCEACKCNEEEEEIKDAKINYQMLQTLSDMTNDELEILCKQTNDDILNAVKDRDTMLKTMGVSEKFNGGTYLQKCLKIYPELLSDSYLKETLKQNKASLVKQARSGRITIDGKYTFVCPDVYAFMEWLFLGIEEPKGLLETNEVSCNLFDDGIELDCLRSPHLSIEHTIRKNVISKEMKRWYKTSCIYTSTRDLISKVLQFDCDGDRLLLIKDKLIIDVAKRNVKRYDIVPLFYNMKKANSELVSNDSLLKGLKDAYVGGNIGIDSNKISKCLNNMVQITDDMSDKEIAFSMEENNKILKCVKLLCMHNNFEIDYAKTLFSIEFDETTEQMIKEYTSQKLPFFFKFAKDKMDDQVEEINNSTVNRMYHIIKNPRLNFNSSNVGICDHTKLMRNKDINIDNEVIKMLTYLKKNKKKIMKEHRDGKYKEYYINSYIRNRILEINNNIEDVSDMLVKYCFKNNVSNKDILFNSFGDVVLKNLETNIPKNTKQCNVCGERFEYVKKVGKPEIYCSTCKREKELEKYAKYNKNR